MTQAASAKIAVLASLVVGVTACGAARPGTPALPAAPGATGTPGAESAAPGQGTLEELMARTREAVPERPDLVQPTTSDGTRIWRAGVLGRGLRILVSTEGRALWLMRDTVVLMQAPVAVGMDQGFEWKGKRYHFKTPVGQRRILEKDDNPIWVPPDWHYFETALERDLEAVQLRNGQRIRLADGSAIEVRGRDVGRVNEFGNFYAFEPGSEIIFDGHIYIPPFGTRQRQVPDVLGTHKLVLGDGYLIHGTNQETSVGDAVSHGCIRMYNEDVARLYEMVRPGTPVFIF
jgi:hypothetical protein